MKKISTLLLFFIVFGAKSQTISEKLGAVSTNFKITSASQPLNVTNQIILKQNRTESKKDHEDYEYAVYERYYFQFVSVNELVKSNRSKVKEEALYKRNHDFYFDGYFIRFFDENDILTIMQKFYDALKPEGYFVFSVPYMEEDSDDALKKGFHKAYFIDEKKIARWMENTHFQVEQLFYQSYEHPDLIDKLDHKEFMVCIAKKI